VGHTRAYTVRPTRIPARSHRVNGSTREAREALSRATSLGLPRDLKEKSEDLLTSIEHAERKAANSEAVRRKEVADALKELERLVVGSLSILRLLTELRVGTSARVTLGSSGLLGFRRR